MCIVVKLWWSQNCASQFVFTDLTIWQFYFTTLGKGINPANGQVWSQDDMDDCGGRDDANGNYGYYVTGKGYWTKVFFINKSGLVRGNLIKVDFPYILQCYRGTPDSSIRQTTGNCGLWGASCNYSGTGGGQGQGQGSGTGSGNRPSGPPGPPGREIGNNQGKKDGKKKGNKRGKRSTTAEWIQASLDFHGGDHPYFKAKFGLTGTYYHLYWYRGVTTV